MGGFMILSEPGDLRQIRFPLPVRSDVDAMTIAFSVCGRPICGLDEACLTRARFASIVLPQRQIEDFWPQKALPSSLPSKKSLCSRPPFHCGPNATPSREVRGPG